MGYIICEKCRGYYELQPGEHLNDFDKCQCGGKLKYEQHFIDKEDYNSPSIEKQSGFKLSQLSKNIKTLGTGAVVLIVLLIKILPKLYLIFIPVRFLSGLPPTSTYLIPGIFVTSIIVIGYILSRLRHGIIK